MPAKKTVTKKRSLFSRINFKSPKTRGVLVLLAFALVGGGFMVYRSFADAGIGVRYRAGGSGVGANRWNSTVFTTQDNVGPAGKAPDNQLVFQVRQGGQILIDGSLIPAANKDARVCAYMRGATSSTSVQMNIGNWNGPYTHVNISNIYNTYCSAWTKIASDPMGSRAFVSNLTHSGWVNVYEMWYEVTDTAAPAPSKSPGGK